MGFKFYANDELSEKIKVVCSGENLRIACAFWGVNAFNFLKNNPPSQIVCNVGMGATHAGELRQLGAPNNENLKYTSDLHAKVYLSSEGGVVASANISSNGIGLMGKSPRLVEAGIFFSAYEAEFDNALSWFDQLFASPAQVDDAALKLAEEKFRDRLALTVPVGPVEKVGGGSLLQLAQQQKGSAVGWGYVFPLGIAQPDEEDRAFYDEPDHDQDQLPVWDDIAVYKNWDQEDLSDWPQFFYDARSRGLRKYLFADIEAGTIFAQKLKWNDHFKRGVKLATANDPVIKKLADTGRVFESFAAIKKMF